MGMTIAPSHGAGQKECSQWTLVGNWLSALQVTEASWKLAIWAIRVPIIESGAHLSKVSWIRDDLCLQSKRLIIHLLYSRKSTVISQDCDSSSVSAQPPNSCGSVPGGRCDGTVLSYMTLRGGELEIWWDESWGAIICFSWSPFWVLSFTTSADFLWGYSMNGMGLSWRVSSKIITSNWFWKPASWFLLLERSSVDIGNRFHCGWVMSMWPQCPAPVLKLTSVGTELSSCPISLCTEAELS